VYNQGVNGTVVIGAIGLVTTAASPIFASRLVARDQKSAWQRDARAAIYTEAMAYAQTLESGLDAAIIPELGGWPRAEVKHADLITARMRLVATKSVFEAWQSLTQAWALFRWNVQDEFPGLGNEHSDPLPADYPDLVSLRRALEHFYAVAGRAL